MVHLQRVWPPSSACLAELMEMPQALCFVSRHWWSHLQTLMWFCVLLLALPLARVHSGELLGVE